MNTFYSMATRGFYPESMRPDYDAAGSWPPDAVAVSDAEEAAIRTALQRGDTVTRLDGKWTFAPYVPTAAELIAAAEQYKAATLAVAAQQIAILTEATDPAVVDDPSAADAALLLLWKKYRQALRALVTTDPNSIVWPVQPALA